MEIFRHEKYKVWNESVRFAVFVCKLSQKFPSYEKFALTDQMRRAAVAISSNIAEGSGRNSDADFARFLGIAYGSLMELLTQSEIAYRLDYFSEEQYQKIRALAAEIAKMLSGLRNRLINKP